LARSARRRDVVFGATVSGRPAEISGIETMIGLFINTLPVRVEADPAAQLAPWLRQLQEGQAELRQYEYSPLVDVQGWSAVPRGLPLFETVLVFENYPVDETPPEAAGDRGLAVYDSEFTFRTNYPLMLVARPGARLALRLSYDARRFDEESIARTMDHLASLLASMPRAASEGRGRLGDLALLSPAERAQILDVWNDRSTDLPVAAPLHALFSAAATRHPRSIAITSEEGDLTYADLDARSNRLAHHLRKLGAGPEVPVGILLERTRELPVAILAVLKAGAAYLPLDPAHPRERIAYTLADAGAPILVTEERLADLAAGSAPLAVVTIDGEAEAIAARPASALETASTPENLAYVIYTSGSTGRPKGTLVEHRQAVRLFRATEERFAFSPDDVWTLFHSAAFDFSVWEIWGALLYGGRLVVVPAWVARSAPDFLKLLAHERVTVLNQTPSAFRELARADEEAAARGETPDLALRLVVFGGEALDPASLAGWVRRRGTERPLLANMYGITETTVHVTWRELSATDCEAPGRSPIGRALPDLQVYPLDADFDLAPVGVPGELAVAGAGLARGYLGRPELTAQRFAPSPFGEEPGARLYLSGDLARWLPGGELEYLGRIDGQVKIRGYRIELGEIEAALRGLPGIADAAVLARTEGQGASVGEPRLVAYVVFATGHGGEGVDLPALAALADALRERLPAYMIPSAFVPLASLPLTANGKLDRRALPAPESSGLARAYVAPRGPVEELIAEVWADVLGVERAGGSDNFFDLGGHSLLATQVASRLARAFGVELPLRDLFEAEDLAALARRVEAARQAATESDPSAHREPPLVPVPREGKALPLSFAQQRLWFLEQLAPGRPTYNIATPVRVQGLVRADLL
ncbi:MAG TPA: amino acid adenylation domain-containing protein, partial [Thermoanaerobaculia bacterium]|nr:amino acid adenylation domain-containing protein [Thermoanaerobaculia bacterium]